MVGPTEPFPTSPKIPPLSCLIFECVRVPCFIGNNHKQSPLLVEVPTTVLVLTDIATHFQFQFPLLVCISRSLLSKDVWLSVTRRHCFYTAKPHAWTGHCAIVQWHRRPFRRTQAPPGPFEIFWRVRYGEKFYYRCGPCLRPWSWWLLSFLS